VLDLNDKSVSFCCPAKLLPVGYGINKLNILMTIEDEKVSIDELIEDDLCGGPETSEYVQSCDIVAFNKICE
jgi:elongation factor 1-beta